MTLSPISPAVRRIRGRRVLLVMAAIVVFAAVPAVIVPMVLRGDTPALNDYGMIPAFGLTDERGQPFTEAALRGHPTIVSFIFTRCDMICPVTMATMARIQEKTFDAGEKIKLLSISVDPDFDTPARLDAYARKFRTDPTRWRLVTGPLQLVTALVEGPLMTSMQRKADRPGGIPDIAHGGYFLLIDGQLHLRGRETGATYSSSDVQSLDALIRDARYLSHTTK